MITNERAARITRAQIEKFRESIATAEHGPTPARTHPKLHRAAIDGVRSQLADLEADLAIYEGIKTAAGKRKLSGRFADLGALITQARIARGWTQAQLAERLGLHMQKIQEYESRGFDRASLTRAGEILQALGAEVTVSIKLISIPMGLDALVKDAAARGPKRAARAGA